MRIALTGGIASGKTAVSKRLAGLGAHVIDADVLAREVVEPETRGFAAVVAEFGEGVLGDDGRLDRAVLGGIVFADPGARARINAIVHPLVRRRAAELEAMVPRGAVVVHVIPLLVETGQVDQYDLVVVVDAQPAEQVRRLMARNGLSREDAEARLAAQASRNERLSRADVVLSNTGAPAELAAQVDALWDRLTDISARRMPCWSPAGGNHR